MILLARVTMQCPDAPPCERERERERVLKRLFHFLITMEIDTGEAAAFIEHANGLQGEIDN